MAVLNMLKKVKVQTLSFEKHPCKDLDLEIKIHYLNGLSLIMNEDGDMDEKEKEYISILINSFDLPKEQLDEFIEFAQNPDEDSIYDMMSAFSSKDIKYNFMVDCIMLAMRDGEFCEKEEAIIEQYFEMFKISEKEAQDLSYIFEMFHTQNGNALYRYFKRNEYLKIELFQYLLDYYKIDMAYELIEDEKKILTFEFFKPVFKEGGLGGGATEIMTKPVNNVQFCIYLNSAFMDKTIELDSNGKVVESESKNLLMDLDNSDIEFKDGVFMINSVKYEEKKITGMTYKLIDMFIKWINSYKNEKYEISTFFVSNHSISTDAFNNDLMENEYIKFQHTYGCFLVLSVKEIYFSDNWCSTGYKTIQDNNYNSIKTSFRMIKLPKED